MNATIQDTLLEIFQQVSDAPESIPAIHIDAWQEGSQERHLLTSFRDMLERVQQHRREAEKQLREREEQYRSIFEATTDGLIISDWNGTIVEVNPAACKMFGYPYDEFLGLSPTATLHPDDLPVVVASLRTIQVDGQAQARHSALRKDSTPFPTEVHGTTFTYLGKPHSLGVVRDITERVEAERQLREKEEQYRGIFEAATDAMFITTLEGVIAEANPAACKMLGYSYEEIIGLSPAVLVDADSLPRVAEDLQALQAGMDASGHMILLRKDGTTFPTEGRSTIFAYKGRPHVLAVLRDITERVEAEKQLREREEQYRSVFEATYDGLIILDMDGFYVDVNPAYCSMFGYTREELIGRHASILTAPESLLTLTDALKTLKTGRGFQTVGGSLRKDGTTFYVEGSGTTFTYRGKPHVLGVSRDITERLEAERELREREEQYRSIFEATNDALCILDLEDGHVVEVNPALCDIYGYSYEELIGLPPSTFIHPDQLPGLLEIGLPLIRAGGERHVQGVNLRKDGSVFPIDLHQSVFTYQGKPHMLCVIRDITEQVQAQQLLEQRVEERTRELASLLEISHTVASTLQLKPLVGLILDQLKTVVDYSGASILTVEGADLVYLDNRGPVSQENLAQLHFPLKSLGAIWEMANTRESIIIDDTSDETPLAQAFRVALGELGETIFHYVRACLIVPLVLKERVIGMLVLNSSEPGAFTQHHATLALAIANQAAIAIENARLYAQARDLAALEERQKLARELHDSVSQALYGIALGTHTARTLLDRDPRQVAEPLEYVISLAEAGLAEMRALIFELRPESLETEGLVSALSKQGAALQARHGITVQTGLSAEPELPLTVKQELYRVAQEALHNTAKHAHASTVNLRLSCTTEAVILEVRDDGAGFDPGGSFPGHLGLHSMRERVTNLGGTFQIESAPGQGTCIQAQVPFVV